MRLLVGMIGGGAGGTDTNVRATGTVGMPPELQRCCPAQKADDIYGLLW